MFKMKKGKSSFILNIILLIILVLVVLKENYVEAAIYKINLLKGENSKSYQDNWEYQQAMDFYNYYNKKGTIVMLGNSITYRANWNELLNRTDVINRGVGGDTTEAMLSRMSYVYNVEPDICFVMAGINDIFLEIGLEKIEVNYTEILNQLQQSQIEPIVFSTLYVSDTQKGSSGINKQVKSLNDKLKSICDKKGIQFVDVNAAIGNTSFLKKEYSFDGVHLTGLAYKKWSETINDILIEKGLTN